MASKRMSVTIVSAVVALAMAVAPPAGAQPGGPVVHDLATFAAAGCEFACGSGSSIGPGGDLYVTDGSRGRVLRVDRRTGAVSTWASGFPRATRPPGLGGAIDLVFVGRTAYVLVGVVLPAQGQPPVVTGIYRVDRGGTPRVVADIGAWSVAHPPAMEVQVPIGVPYAIERFRDAFLVTDGHHNRVLLVRHGGDVSELRAFGNVVPTGLDVHGRTIYLGLAGPVPHAAADGRVVSFTAGSRVVRTLAAGAPLLVDVELGRRHGLYALAQGAFPAGGEPGAPASPNTGRLMRAHGGGRLATLVAGLDRPTSLELVGRTAYVVTLTGKVLRVTGLP